MDNKKNGIPKLRFPGFTGAWEQRKLGEVVNFLDTLRKPLEGAKRVKGPYPYYGASGIVDYVDGYLFDEELILLSEDGANITERNYPVCFLASGKYWVNNHAHVLKIKEDNDNNFICNSLERKDYTKYNTGMAMPKLNKETCKGIPIMCPNYDEQKKIGNYFRKFDTLIALHQRKLEHLQEQKKGLLQKMFPKNGETVPEVRFPGFTDDWEQRKLGEVIVSEHKGKVKSSMKGGNTNYLETNYLNGGTAQKVDAIADVSKDDVLILWDGSKAGTIYHGFEGALGSTLKAYVPKYSGDFLYQILKKNQDKIYQSYRTPNIPHVIKNFTEKFNVSIPTIIEQQEIGDFFKQLDSLITLHQRKLEHLELMKKGLLQQMFV